jgi:hypothetical protein
VFSSAEFHIQGYNDLLAITIKPEAKMRFLARAMLLSYFLQNVP